MVDRLEPDQKILSIGGNKSKANGSADLKVNRITEKGLVNFFRKQIRRYSQIRRSHKVEVEKAIDAYEARDKDYMRLGLWRNPYRDRLRIGIPYAASQTTVAAIVSNSPEFKVKPQNEDARDLANLIQVVLNNDAFWKKNKRQWQMARLVRNCQNTGLMIGSAQYDTDLDVWEKRLAKDVKALEERSTLDRDEEMRDLLAHLEIEKELSELKASAPKEFGVKPDHSLRMDELGMKVQNYFDYVADPDAEDLAYGPRWEGTIKRLLIKDVRNSSRYRRGPRRRIKPTAQVKDEFLNHFNSSSGSNSTFDESVPEEWRLVEVYEIYWYDDPEYKDSYGSLISFTLNGDDELLERRPNPWGRRPYVVEDWNGDTHSLFPTPDFSQWHDIWRAFTEVTYRLIRQARKAPNNTLIMDMDSPGSSYDEWNALLDNDDGGVVPLPLGGMDDIRKKLFEISTKQVSPEYINIMQYLIFIIQMIEGFGPNQFAGGALKSETSASEAVEIAQFSRARVSVKAHALDRFMTRMAENLISGLLRFKGYTELINIASPELAAAGIELNTDKVRAAALEDVSIEIMSGSMAPDGFQNKLQKISSLIGVITQLPQLQQQLDSDTLLNLVRDTFRLETGEEMFVGMDTDRALMNAIQAMMQQGGPGGGGGGGGGGIGAPAGQAPGPQPMTPSAGA